MSALSSRKPKVFIVSSKEAQPIAEALISKLKKTAKVIPWWKVFDNGAVTLPTLLKHAADSDFAIVFLTKDEIRIRNAQESWAARENCIYELGLFTGALGLEPKRAFILSSLDNNSMLSDLGGVTYIKITEPGDSSAEAMNEWIKITVDKIKKNIQELKRCYNHPNLKFIPTDDLIEMERYGGGGNLVENASKIEVIVHTAQPIEKKHPVAQVVQKNMVKGVNYNYFFEAEKKSIDLLPSLIRTLAAAALLDVKKPKTLDDKAWKQEMIKSEEAKKHVRAGLENMKEHLRIFLLAHREPVQLCIHNANLDDDAICYLKYPPRHFVEWCTADNAIAWANKLRNKCPSPLGQYIFHGSTGSTAFDLYGDENREVRNHLLESVKNMFDDHFHDLLEDVCFRKEHVV